MKGKSKGAAGKGKLMSKMMAHEKKENKDNKKMMSEIKKAKKK